MQQQLDLVVLTDIHYVHRADHVCAAPERHARMGLELAQRVVQEIQRGSGPDALVLMGDLVDSGDASGADEDLIALRSALQKAGVPILVVPGNHDGSAQRLLRLFDDHPGLHLLNGYTLLTFADEYDAHDNAARSPEGLALVRQAASKNPDRLILAFQHNVIHPPIDSSYPFNLSNSHEVMAGYSANGVVLSVSGHLHPGHRATDVDGVEYVVAPALSEAPFRFLRIALHGRKASIREIPLEMSGHPPLWDAHVHTQYAYCATTVETHAAIERARLFGLAGLGFVEHAPQLYVAEDDFWSASFLNRPEILREQREAERDRMRGFQAEMLPLRNECVCVGLEVECDQNGNLTLLKEDRDGWGFLVGAVHWLPENFQGRTPADDERGFMRATECLLRRGVQVLAHPFRYFRRHNVPTPSRLFGPVADLLAEYGAAAELNYHTNIPDPDFFTNCLDRGVSIALGSDAHALHEVGALRSYLEFLRQIGADPGQGDTLFRPARGS